MDKIFYKFSESVVAKEHKRAQNFVRLNFLLGEVKYLTFIILLYPKYV